jgi:dTDP-4-amino-4,6-dideoxygalactose transaminase
MKSKSPSFVPFASPEIDDSEINEVIDTLKSGWVTAGPKVKQFEYDFKEYIGDDVEAIAVSSATAGLHLALEALGVGPGDEIIVPALTFTSTAEVGVYLGAKIVIVDVEPVTLTIDIDAIKDAITPKTKVIMPVHYAGLSCEMDKIFAVANKHNIKVVEDAAHALPTTYKNKMIGTLKSDVTVFSFYANKTITTGEGGMVVTQNKELAKRIRVTRLHGIDRDASKRFLSKKPVSYYYEVIAAGYKYNMTDINASMGIHQLKKLPNFSKRRRYLFERYYEFLEDLPLILPCKGTHDSVSSYHLFVIRLTENSNIERDYVINFLSSRGIGTSVHYVPLYRHPYWRDKYNLKVANFPVTEKAFQAMITLPLYSAMSDEQQDRVISSLQEALL